MSSHGGIYHCEKGCLQPSGKVSKLVFSAMNVTCQVFFDYRKEDEMSIILTVSLETFVATL